MGEYRTIARTTDVPRGEGAVIEVGGLSIALFNVDGTFWAIDNTCCHRGGPLGDGELDDNVVTCPWHLWRYDVTTGECVSSPGERVRRYDVVVEGEEVRLLL